MRNSGSLWWENRNYKQEKKNADTHKKKENVDPEDNIFFFDTKWHSRKRHHALSGVLEKLSDNIWNYADIMVWKNAVRDFPISFVMKNGAQSIDYCWGIKWNKVKWNAATKVKEPIFCL